MTTVKQENGGDAGRAKRLKKLFARGGNGGSAAGGGTNPWNRVWQVPLLMAGLVVFGVGVRAVVKMVKPVPFAEHVRDVRTLIAVGRYEDAVNQINVLGNYFKTDAQQGVLQQLAGDVDYLAQQQEKGFVRVNYQHVADHYREAVALGVKPDATMNERWGEAGLALGDAPLALEKLEAAIAADPTKLRPHVRDLVAAHVAEGEVAKAQALLTQMVKQPEATVDERAWAWCKQLELGKGGSPAEVKAMVAGARGALEKMPERDPAGRVLLAIARVEFAAGQMDAAKKDLTDARQRFVVRHLDDGRASLMLAKIDQASGDLPAAKALYDEAALSDEGTTLWAAARFGRAEIAALSGHPDPQMQEDYRFVIHALTQQEEPGSVKDATVGVVDHTPELVTLDEVRASLLGQYQKCADADRLDDALMFLSLAEELHDPVTASTASRWATARERRAAELMQEAEALPTKGGEGEQRAKKMRDALTLYGQAGENYLQHSKLMTLDDAVSGNSLWHGAQLLDKAGQTLPAIAAYKRFVMERPRDSRTPEGLLEMGRLYQSVGALDDAIPIYERNIKENGKTPAAYASAVNLARCYMAKGPEGFEKAEKSLLSLVQDNQDLDPNANEFRASLFTLGELYYDNGRWADAILRLEEAVDRYPSDKGVPQALFMLAQSYRKSAGDIQDAIQKNPAIEHREALSAARLDRLRRAASLFGKVIGAMDVDAEQAIAGQEPTLSPLEADYLRTSYMNRAECYFQLGEFPTAIKYYDQTATRFAEHVTAAEAYVQIVNGYLAMKEPGQAHAAAERAQWILKRIPDEAFAKSPASLNRQYFEDFFKLGGDRQGAT
jgi:tetratricopeptide (TPR) repeat protein